MMRWWRRTAAEARHPAATRVRHFAQEVSRPAPVAAERVADVLGHEAGRLLARLLVDLRLDRHRHVYYALQLHVRIESSDWDGWMWDRVHMYLQEYVVWARVYSTIQFTVQLMMNVGVLQLSSARKTEHKHSYRSTNLSPLCLTNPKASSLKVSNSEARRMLTRHVSF